jgi:hypothetical protein
MSPSNAPTPIVFALLSAAAATLVTPSFAQAQVRVTDTYLPASNIKKENPPPGESATLEMNILDVATEIPFLVSKDEAGEISTALVNELAFRHHALKLVLPAGQSEYFPKNLYAIREGLTLIQALSEDWYAVGFGAATLATDFKDIGFKHFVFEGGAFGVYKITKALHVGLGPVFTFAFGNPLLIPAPFVRYQGEQKLSFQLQVPRFAKVAYAFSEGFDLGVAGRFLYNNYRLGDDRARTPDGKSTVIVFSDITVGLEASLRIFQPLFATAGVGATVYRKFRVDDDGGDELFNRDLENTPYASLGLELRM